MYCDKDVVSDSNEWNKSANKWIQTEMPYFSDLVQDFSNSSANALELLQSCTKTSKWSCVNNLFTNSILDPT